MRKLTILCFILTLSSVFYAQQEAQYTQFSYNNLLLNPGFAGARRFATATALYRNQWMGYDGRPISFLTSFDAPFPKSRLGAGLTVGHQQEGVIQRNFANLALNYDMINTKDITLRVGLSGNIKKYRFDLQDPQVYIENLDDENLKQQNPYLYKTNIGTGVYFDMKSFYLGLSCPNLIKNPLELNTNHIFDAYAVEQRHFYLQTGGFFRLGSEHFHLKPSAMVKYVVNSPLSVDLNLGLMYNRTFLFGGSFRTGNSKYGGSDAFSLNGFFQATPELGIGMAYDFPLSQIRTVTAGSMEVLMRYDFVKNKVQMHNPRYFF